MRISTSSFYSASLPGIQSQQSSIARLNQQITTDQNYLAPRDNPVATTKLMGLSASVARQEQYLTNIQRAELILKEESTYLSEMEKALGEVSSLLQGISASQDPVLRERTAQQLGNYYLHIKDLANSKDSSGSYVFAGYQTDTLPFDHTQAFNASLVAGTTPSTASPTTDYPNYTITTLNDTAENRVRNIQIGNGQQVQVSDTLQDIFQPNSLNDLLQTIDQAAIDLVENPAALATNLASYQDTLIQARDTLQVLITDVAGRTVILQGSKASHEALKLNNELAYDALQNLDEAAAIVELQQRQVTLQASMQAFTTVSGLSLFNYL